jgi:hypothetical protein
MEKKSYFSGDIAAQASGCIMILSSNAVSYARGISHCTNLTARLYSQDGLGHPLIAIDKAHFVTSPWFILFQLACRRGLAGKITYELALGFR